MDTEHRLLPSHALAPEPEQLQPQVQGELRGVRMERRLSAAYGNQTLQLPECLAVVGQWICEGFLQLRQLPLTAVNANASGMRHGWFVFCKSAVYWWRDRFFR